MPESKREAMKAFYHGCGDLPDVGSDSPVEVIEVEALQLLGRLRGNSSFLGLLLDDGFVLQFMYEQGTLHTEILNRRFRSLESCTLSAPLAEESIRAASRGEPIKQIAERAFIKWQHEQVA